jgi:hypothetical protein
MLSSVPSIQVSLPTHPFPESHTNALVIEDMFFQGILINISLTLDEAFKVLEEKCMRRGEGFQYYWHVSAAWGIVEWKLGRENFEAVKVQSTDRISKLYHKVLAFQERPRKPPEIPPSATLSRVGGGINTSASWNYSANVLGVYEFRRKSASAAVPVFQSL